MRQREIEWPALDYPDPAWRILLDLFVEAALGRVVTISSACIASGAPPSTGLRIIKRLVDAGYVLRRRDTQDARLVYVFLSEEAQARLNRQLQVEAASANTSA